MWSMTGRDRHRSIFDLEPPPPSSLFLKRVEQSSRRRRERSDGELFVYGGLKCVFMLSEHEWI